MVTYVELVPVGNDPLGVKRVVVVNSLGIGVKVDDDLHVPRWL